MERGEDTLRNARRQLFAGFRGPRLEQHGMALRWTGHVERPSHREIRAPVVQEVHLVRNEVATCGAIPNEGIVIPTIPQPAHHIREFDCTLVALAMLIMLGAAEIP